MANYNIVSFDGFSDDLTNYISLNAKKSVIIGENTGQEIITSESLNTYNNTFIGYQSGQFADKISNSVLLGYNTGKQLLNGSDNILIGADNTSNINLFSSNILIGNSNILNNSNLDINIFGNRNNANNNISLYTNDNNIFGNNNKLTNINKSIIIGNNNLIENNEINSNYIYIGNDLHINSNITLNINNIIYTIDNNIYIPDNNTLVIGYNENNLIDTFKNLQHNIYLKDGISTRHVSFVNNSNKCITIYSNDNLTSNINYILPRNITNFQKDTTYFLSVNSSNELLWQEYDINNVYLSFETLNRIDILTSNFANSTANNLDLNSDLNINGVLTVDRINLSSGTAIISRDDLTIAIGPAGPRGLQGVKGNPGNDGSVGPKGDKGSSINNVDYNNETGVLTFSSDEGLEYITGDIRGPKGDGFQNVTFNSVDNTITFIGANTANHLDFTTPSLKGDTGPKGDNIGRVRFYNSDSELLNEIGDVTYGSIDVIIPKGDQGDIGPEGPIGPKGDPGDSYVVTDANEGKFITISNVDGVPKINVNINNPNMSLHNEIIVDDISEENFNRKFTSKRINYNNIENTPTLSQIATTGQYSNLINAPVLSHIATTGQYSNLINAPSLSQIATTGQYSNLINAPSLSEIATTGQYSNLINAPSLSEIATTGQYSNLINAPSLSQIATTGQYSNLINAPSLSEIATTGQYSNLINAPSLSEIATTGQYSNLINAPVLSQIALSGQYSNLINAPSLSQIALSGEYSNLINAPVLSEVALSGQYSNLINAPVLSQIALSGQYSNLINAPVLSQIALSGEYSNLINAPSLSQIALSGQYSNLINAPVLSDIALSGQYSNLINAPSLSQIALSGEYSNLINAPSLSQIALSGEYSNLINAPSLSQIATTGQYSNLINAPSLSTVATTGQYSNLINAPSLSTVATTGQYSNLINAPSLSTVATTGQYSNLINAPSLSTVATTGQYSNLINAPVLSQVATTGQYSNLINAPVLYTDADARTACFPLTTSNTGLELIDNGLNIFDNNLWYNSIDGIGRLYFYENSFTSINAPNTGLKRIAFKIGYVDKLQINDTNIISFNNVGIGSSSPTQILDIRPSVSGSYFKINQYGHIVMTNGNSSTKWTIANRDGGGLSIANNSTATNDLINYSDDAITINSNKNVGIGTSSPSYKLDVNGSFNCTSLNVGGLPFNGGGLWSTSSPSTNTTNIFYNDNSSLSGTHYLGGSIVTITGNITDNQIGSSFKSGLIVERSNRTQGLAIGYNGVMQCGNNGDAHLHLRSKGTNGKVFIGNNVALPLTVTESKVGINNSNPSYPLDVSGDINLTGSIYKNNLLLNTATIIKYNGAFNSTSFDTSTGFMRAEVNYSPNWRGSTTKYCLIDLILRPKNYWGSYWESGHNTTRYSRIMLKETYNTFVNPPTYDYRVQSVNDDLLGRTDYGLNLSFDGTKLIFNIGPGNNWRWGSYIGYTLIELIS